MGTPWTVPGRQLSPRLLGLPGGGGQAWGTPMPAAGRRITRGRSAWPGGLEGRPAGHGCSEQLEACEGQNRKTRRPEEPSLAHCSQQLGSLPPGQLAVTTGISAWAGRLGRTQTVLHSPGNPSSTGLPPKATAKINRSHSQPLPHFSELQTGTRSKVTYAKSPEAKEQRHSGRLCVHVCVHTYACMRCQGWGEYLAGAW